MQLLKGPEEQSLVFRVTQYGLRNQYFTFNKLVADLSLNDEDYNYLWHSLTAHELGQTTPNHIMSFAQTPKDKHGPIHAKDRMYALLPTALYNYIDYLEIVEARRAAKEAKRLSWIAIFIAVITGAVSIILQIIQIYEPH